MLFLSCGSLKAQVQPIYYRFGDEVLFEIKQCAGKLPLNDTIRPYVLWFNTGDTMEIMVTKYCTSCASSKLTWIVANSNRFVKNAVGEKLPIVHGEDLVFTDKLNVLADIGTLRENIITQRYLVSGWIIRFTERRGHMKVLKTYYFQA